MIAIDRRTAMLAACGFAGAPAYAFAQASTPRPPGKIGYLHQVTIDPRNPTFNILQSAWRQLGYVEGDTLLPRAAEGQAERLPILIEELINSGIGVLIAAGEDTVRVAARYSARVPVVGIDLMTDPVEAGLVASYARPSGNVTGLFLDQPSLAAKWIELTRETVPGLGRIAFLWLPASGRSQLDVALRTARAIGLEAMVLEFDWSRDISAMLAAIPPGPTTAIVQLVFPGTNTVATQLVAAAIQHRLPTMGFLRWMAQAGILMSYGPRQESYWPRAVAIADQIVRGAKAGDIPIERPAKFEFVVNLKTARALGITIPPMLQAAADEVIE